jgi:Uma2 family endonuclease
VDPKSSTFYLAPGVGGLAQSNPAGSLSYRMPGAREFPAVDDHIVEPETDAREEMVRGQLVVAMPAQPPHGDQHTLLDFAITPHVAPGYVPSTDLLTRFSEGSNFAADLSIRRAGKDEHGHRHLEELAFEVVSTQTRRDMTIRAEDMTTRGVRRVFAIFVDEDQRLEDTTVEEFIADEGRWRVLDFDERLEDPTLVRPLPVRALLDAALALDETVKVAEAKGSPRTREIRAEGVRKGLVEGKREGKREAIEALCTALAIPLTPEQRASLRELDEVQLDALLGRVATERSFSP